MSKGLEKAFVITMVVSAMVMAVTNFLALVGVEEVTVIAQTASLMLLVVTVAWTALSCQDMFGKHV